MNSNSTDYVYQLQISLNHIKPKIWRRIQVPANYTFKQLHLAIQDSMGWQSNFFDYHLHEFRLNKSLYGDVRIGKDYDGTGEIIPEDQVEVKEYFTAPKTKVSYEYDFGAGWQHTVVLEKILPAVENTKYPICIAGKRACPPEDDNDPDEIEGYDPELFDSKSVVFHEGKRNDGTEI